MKDLDFLFCFRSTIFSFWKGLCNIFSFDKIRILFKVFEGRG